MISNRKMRIARPLVSTYMIIMLLTSGCANKYGKVLDVPKDRVEISKTHSEFSALANSSDLPSAYVSEGKIGVSRVESALEEADAVDIQARAELNKKLADFNARRTEVKAQVNGNLSEATAFREKYNKEYSKAMAQITAREAELSAFIEQKDTIVVSLQKEGESKHNDIVADSREKFDSETARIEQLKQIYNAIEAESNANILEMTEASKATRERADATVLELEAEASSVELETTARLDELSEQIESTEIQTRSEADRLIGRLAGEGGGLPNPHLLMRPFVRREAVLSSRIEGTQATLGELLAREAGAIVERSPDDLQQRPAAVVGDVVVVIRPG